MALFRKYKNLFLFALLCPVLCGCSLVTEFFIINTTDQKVTALIKLNKPVEDYLNDGFSIQLIYIDSILKINANSRQQLTNKHIYGIPDTTTLAVDLPPKSTTLVGGGLNSYIPADSVSFTIDNVTETYSFTEVMHKSKKSGGFFSAIRSTYTIK